MLQGTEGQKGRGATQVLPQFRDNLWLQGPVPTPGPALVSAQACRVGAKASRAGTGPAASPCRAMGALDAGSSAEPGPALWGSVGARSTICSWLSAENSPSLGTVVSSAFLLGCQEAQSDTRPRATQRNPF